MLKSRPKGVGGVWVINWVIGQGIILYHFGAAELELCARRFSTVCAGFCVLLVKSESAVADG